MKEFDKSALPDPEHIEQWLSSELNEIRAQGRLSELWKHEPFEHCVIPNFLNRDAYRPLDESSWACGAEFEESDGVGTDVGATFQRCEAGIRFFLGKAMRSFYEELSNHRLKPVPEVPQLRRFPAGSKGVAPHTDYGVPYDVIMLFQMTAAWSEGFGGELVLWKRDGEKARLTRTIPPHANTLICLRVTENSVHSVAAMNGSWERRNLLFEWCLV